MDIEKHYTLKEISEATGIHYNTLYMQYKRGVLKAVKIGGTIRVSQSTLDNYLKGVQ